MGSLGQFNPFFCMIMHFFTNIYAEYHTFKFARTPHGLISAMKHSGTVGDCTNEPFLGFVVTIVVTMLQKNWTQCFGMKTSLS